ncbi:MAG: DeoR/GlpR transcriptional regulator [Rhodobacteraceae bacterium]|nr:DeoR/GlpR transcriptional regulator [Paracoccaceae bacterium]
MAGRPSSSAIRSGSVASADARREAILSELGGRGRVHLAYMAEKLGVSAMTLRRDLDQLEDEGLLERIRGGAIPTRGTVIIDTVEPEFQRRIDRARADKESIAEKAASLLVDVQTLALDVGTTTLALARRLTDSRQTKVFTNNLRIAQVLADAGIELYLAGGLVRPIEQAVGGPSAISQFEALWFDVAVIGTSGITADGFFDYSFEDSAMKRVYFSRATRRIVLADSAKFNRKSLVRISSLESATDLVTEAEPPEEIAAALAKAGVKVHIAALP